MSRDPKPGAVLYAKDVAAVAAFYRDVFSLAAVDATDDHVVLETPAFQLVILEVPAALGRSIKIDHPPRRRTQTPIKLVFPVDSITDARTAATARGGELNPPEREWEFQDCRVCDGHDPEGNVVQARARMYATDDPAGHAGIDALVRSFFAAFDNRNGREADADELLALFAENAIVAKDEAGEPALYSPVEFIAPRVALLKSGAVVGFHEWEDSAITDVRGSIAIRTSRYSKSGTFNGELRSGSGTKFFQFARLAKGWKIVALSWIDDP